MPFSGNILRANFLDLKNSLNRQINGDLEPLKNSLNRQINGDLEPRKGFGINFFGSYYPLIYLNIS